MYDYLFLDLRPTEKGPALRGLADQLKAVPPKGVEIVGLFQPQLGWRSRQAALLLRRTAGAADAEAAVEALGRSGAVEKSVRDRLTPTVRPQSDARPPPGGIYVHRWFVVSAEAVPEFVDLSAQGWRDFEARFETRIFGLFQAERTEQDRQRRVTRLLLITRYRDHGVWETSRDPTTEAMATFARRARLTLDSWAASTLLVRI